MLRNHKKWMFYSLYTAAAALFFLYALFPSEAVQGYIVSAARKVLPNATVTIDRVAPIFPPGVRASAVVFSEGGLLELSAGQLEFIPKIQTLFGPTPTFSFNGRSYDGQMTGTMMLNRDRSLRAVHADLSDMQIESMAAVQRLSGHHVSGIISGTVDIEKADGASRLTANLAASDFRMDLKIPGVNLKELTFTEVNARLTASSASDLRIESLTAKGRQVNGDLSGAIKLKAPRPKSELDLTGSVKPHPSFISSLGSTVSMLFQNQGGNNTFPFMVKGTIESPDFLLR